MVSVFALETTDRSIITETHTVLPERGIAVDIAAVGSSPPGERAQRTCAIEGGIAGHVFDQLKAWVALLTKIDISSLGTVLDDLQTAAILQQEVKLTFQARVVVLGRVDLAADDRRVQCAKFDVVQLVVR